MILTGDNLLRFVKEKKAVTPMMVSEAFEITTMIASAALSDLTKKNLITITHLKLATSPYYYDIKQNTILIKLGEKHLSGYEKNIFLKLKEQEVLNSQSLTIPEKLAIEKLKDFATLLEIENNGKVMKFWVWYLRDIPETKKQILEILNGNKKVETKQVKTTIIKEVKSAIPKKFIENTSTKYKQKTPEKPAFETKKREEVPIQRFNSNNDNSFENKVENYIENYFRNNYLKIESKQKNEKGIQYDVKLNVNKLEVNFACFYFNKKPSEIDIIKFYSSSVKPKILFIQNVPKKFDKLSDNLENLTIINI